MPLSSALTKAHIIDALAERNGFTRRKSIETVEILLEFIKQSLESGDDVLISSFGKLCVKQKAKRKGRNPATGNDMIIGHKLLTDKKKSVLNSLETKLSISREFAQKTIEKLIA